MRKNETRLSEEQFARLQTLAARPDECIDTSDIPETADWSTARRNKFYAPGSRHITLQLDQDILDWFKANTPADSTYQQTINQALRTFMEQSTP